MYMYTCVFVYTYGDRYVYIYYFRSSTSTSYPFDYRFYKCVEREREKSKKKCEFPTFHITFIRYILYIQQGGTEIILTFFCCGVRYDMMRDVSTRYEVTGMMVVRCDGNVYREKSRLENMTTME